MRRFLSAFTAIGLLLLFGTAHAADAIPEKVDILIYGGTSGGVMAAVSAANAGRSVVLVEPGRHLGGLSSGGLGATDIGNKAVIGGLSRQFYKRLGKVYGTDENWTFEPHVAEKLFREFLDEAKVPVVFEHRLRSVDKAEGRLTRVTLEHAPPDDRGAPAAKANAGEPKTIAASVFIDATYEGDLLAAAKVSYHVGREANSVYGETLNGVRDRSPGHSFKVKVDPYVKPGDPESGLLPFVQKGDGGKTGDGDKSVQAYNFRLCLTQTPANRLAFPKPANYDETHYELLARYLEALDKAGTPATVAHVLSVKRMPNGKTDMNNNNAVSTDFIGQNYAYPEGDWATRNRLWHQHLDWVEGFCFFLQNSPRVPAKLKEEINTWGLSKDEFTDTKHWPNQMYIREARRLVGRYVVTQADCEHKRTADDSVGMGAYNMDSHHCQRLVKDGFAFNEGDVQVAPRAPYRIAYRALTPKTEECANLLVPVCISSSHIAYGSARMEPVFMVLGQSAGLAAHQSLEEKKAVQDIDVAKLQKRLRDAGQVLEYTPPAKKEP